MYSPLDIACFQTGCRVLPDTPRSRGSRVSPKSENKLNAFCPKSHWDKIATTFSASRSKGLKNFSARSCCIHCIKTAQKLRFVTPGLRKNLRQMVVFLDFSQSGLAASQDSAQQHPVTLVHFSSFPYLKIGSPHPRKDRIRWS